MKFLILIALLAGITITRAASQSPVATPGPPTTGMIPVSTGGATIGNTVPALTTPSFVRSILSDGASTSNPDNSSDIQASITVVSNAGGGVVSIPRGTFNTTHTIAVPSNVQIRGEGPASVIRFNPACPCTAASGTEAAFRVSGPLTNRRQIAAAIPAGATSFALAQASDGADLSSGEWLIVEEYDKGAGPNQVISTWVQVQRVSGKVVTVAAPFKTAIPHLRPWNNTPGSYSGSSFYGIPAPGPISGVTFRDLSVVIAPNSNLTGAQLLGIYAAQSVRGLTVDNVVIDDASGDALATYLSSDVRITNTRILASRSAGSNGGTSEIAATSGVSIKNSLFGQDVTSNSGFTPWTAGLLIDNGTEYFDIVGNQFDNSDNIGLEIITGAHNCSVVANSFGYISGTSPGDAISGVSVQNCYFAGNTAAGGAGFGIDLESSTGWTVNQSTSANVVDPSGLIGFTRGQYRTATANPSDFYRTWNSFGPIIGGSATFGTQMQFGNRGSFFDTSGTITSSGDPFMAFNAGQTSVGVDNWTQFYSSARSNLMVLDSTKGFCYYTAAAGKPSGTFASFWGTAVWCTSPSGTMTINGSTGIPTTGSPSAGHVACIKSVGPPALIGYCSSRPTSSGTCTCN